MWLQGEDSYCWSSKGEFCHGNFCQRKKGRSLRSVLTQHGDYGSFTPTAKMHWGLISRVNSDSSNEYVSIAQTGQVVDRNANCFTGWWPCNLHASCCVLTVNNCSIYRTLIVVYSNTLGGFVVVDYREFIIFLCSIFISWLIHFLWLFHLLSNEKAHFCWWKFGPFTAPHGKWITYHKDKWPAMAADALLRNGVVLLDVYWNKSWKERARLKVYGT